MTLSESYFDRDGIVRYFNTVLKLGTKRYLCWGGCSSVVEQVSH